MGTLDNTYAQRQSDTSSQIKNLYDQQYNSKAAQLKTAYDQNVSKAQVEQQKIAPQYQTSANQLATQYARNRRNTNLQAMNSGLNTGTAVQQQNALNTAYQNNYTGIRNQEAQAQTEAGQKLVDLGVNYRSDLAAEKASAENAKAVKLIDNQNTLNNWYDTQAKLLASYGDFSGYEKLYGKAAAQQMRDVWIIQNPETALGAGMISANEYKTITGKTAGESSSS